MPVTALDAAKTLFLKNLDKLKGDDLYEFLDWAQEVIDESQYGSKEHAHGGGSHSSKALKTLEKYAMVRINTVVPALIIKDLREKLPIDAMAPSEETHIPPSEREQGLTPANTVHVDSFLYDDEEVDRLCDEGKMSRAICADCGSKNTILLNFVSHSMSLGQLQFVFRQALPNLAGKSVLDVGSRTGAVLYAAHAFSHASQVTGVEMNQYFCDVSREMLEKHGMADRAQVIQADIRDRADLLKAADVIILNNVFEFFFEHDQQAAFWAFLRENITKRGTRIIAVPALQESIDKTGANIQLNQWVVENRLDYGEHADDDDDDVTSIHLYTVK